MDRKAMKIYGGKISFATHIAQINKYDSFVHGGGICMHQ